MHANEPSIMQIKLNGRDYELPEDATVAALLKLLNLADRRVAVEVNQMIVPRSQHVHANLQANDQVEIVHAIGGG
ncbi:MAG: sulfur carrier protein ThiS [Wenzhouxiangellaceae bacterium]